MKTSTLVSASVLATALVFLSSGLLLGCGEQAPKVSEKTVQQYQTYCAPCHEAGAANAPRRGDQASWEQRLRKGKAALISSSMAGPVAMPAKGGCNECTTEDMGALIDYLAR